MKRSGFTIVELLVVMAVIGLLVALLLPAVMQAREAARRTQCQSHLRQIGVATHNYHALHGMFPPGGSRGYSLHVFLLPHLEQGTLYRRIDFAILQSDNPTIREHVIPVYSCPSESAGISGVGRGTGTSYAGNFGTGVQRDGYNGVFRNLVSSSARWTAGPVRAADVTDGLSQTAAVSEVLLADGSQADGRAIFNTPSYLVDLEQFAEYCATLSPESHLGGLWRRGRPWTDGNPGPTYYNHILPPNSRNCYNGTSVQDGIFSAASQHPGGIHVLFADGHVDFVSEDIDLQVWQAAGSRNGGETVP